MNRSWGVLLAVALALAGCVGPFDDGITAMDVREDANEEASEWNENATLVGVFGLEVSQRLFDMATREAEEESDIHNVTYRADESRGDGKTAAWVYEYVAANGTYTVVLADNGTVLHEEVDEDEPDENFTAEAIEGWEVDSDEAADIVAENNDTWERAEDANITFYALEKDEDESDPTWALGFQAEGGTYIFAVNATTGEYLGAFTFEGPSFDPGFGGDYGGDGNGSYEGPYGPGDEPPKEGGSFSGRLTVTDPNQTHTFEVEASGHPELGVELTLDQPATSTVQATIEGPNGTLGTLEADGMDRAVEGWWEEPMTGTYTVTLELTQGAAQDYQLAWCAEGADYGSYDPPYGPSSSPCDAVDGEPGASS